VPQGKTLWLSPYRVVPELPNERAMVGGICAVVEWVEIEGPLHEQWPSRGHQRLYGDLPLQPANPKAPTKDLRVVSYRNPRPMPAACSPHSCRTFSAAP